jgi:nucleotide-binding universal stress UspA family protein
MILICYDGSPDSRSAIAHAGKLMPGETATVLTVWESFIDVMTRTSAGIGYWTQEMNLEEIDADSEQSARARADEGVKHARRAGLNPQPLTSVRGATTAYTILAKADEVEANAIVLGTRGLTGVKSLLLGSVSHAVLQHADRPVMVVPSPEIAAKRAAHRH